MIVTLALFSWFSFWYGNIYLVIIEWWKWKRCQGMWGMLHMLLVSLRNRLSQTAPQSHRDCPLFSLHLLPFRDLHFSEVLKLYFLLAKCFIIQYPRIHSVFDHKSIEEVYFQSHIHIHTTTVWFSRISLWLDTEYNHNISIQWRTYIITFL